MNGLLDNILNFYGANTSGSYERKLDRVIRFIKADNTVSSQAAVIPNTQQQSATGKKGVKRDRDGEPVASRTRSHQQQIEEEAPPSPRVKKTHNEPVASRTRSNQPVAARTRSQTQY